MISDLHVHTTFCDGKNTPEEMTLSAIEKGVDRLGIVCHAQLPFRADWAIKKNLIKPFQDEVYRVKEKYKDKIEVLCGTELDYFTDIDLDGFEFTIGSVHYFYKDGVYASVDHNEEIFIDSVKRLFNGDYYSACENYYEILSGYATKFNPDFIGHFDLVRKFNKGYKLFDENHPRYIKAMEKALDKLIPLNIPFEINTGAISRGYQDNPYPSSTAIKMIKERGGKLILNSDSHAYDTVAYQFDKWEHLLED
jgi:histidinol-phosphatase (PHP family)